MNTALNDKQFAKVDELCEFHPDYVSVGWIGEVNGGPVFRKPSGDYIHLTTLGTSRRIGLREALAMNAGSWARWILAVKATQATEVSA